jgi:hypothetical protein
MISNQFQSLFKKIMTTPIRIWDVPFTIDERLSNAGIKRMARPQSARCAGKQRRSATLSTIRPAPSGTAPGDGTAQRAIPYLPAEICLCLWRF